MTVFGIDFFTNIIFRRKSANDLYLDFGLQNQKKIDLLKKTGSDNLSGAQEREIKKKIKHYVKLRSINIDINERFIKTVHSALSYSQHENNITELNLKNIHVDALALIHDIAIINGRFRSAYVIYRRYLEQVTKYRCHNSIQYLNLFRSYILLNKQKQAEYVSNKIYKIDNNKESRNFRSFILSIIFLSKSENYNCKNKKQNVFSQKTLSIVGPLIQRGSNRDKSKKIEESDIVLRFNYRGPTQMVNTGQQGFRTDASLYNGNISRFISESEDEIEIDTALFKDYASLINTKNRIKARNNYVIDPCTSMFFSNGNALPITIINCLYLGASSIRIYNSDLMLTRKYYKKTNYRPDKLTEPNIKKVFLGHLPYEQFNTMRILYRNKWIEPENCLSKILKMSTLEYLKKLELAYAKDYV